MWTCAIHESWQLNPLFIPQDWRLCYYFICFRSIKLNSYVHVIQKRMVLHILDSSKFLVTQQIIKIQKILLLFISNCSLCVLSQKISRDLYVLLIIFSV